MDEFSRNIDNKIPMCANQMIHRLFSEIDMYGPPLVAMVGRMTLEPNIANVIPSKVMFTLDVRHPSSEQLDLFCALMIESIEDIAAKRQLRKSQHAPVLSTMTTSQEYSLDNLILNGNFSYGSLFF
jgi:acetylornithine deacetylase/succinyl-diaminopimelate desuccinylase-like protein